MNSAPSAFARHAARQARADRGARALAQPQAAAQHGRDERVEGEDRGGREAGEDRDGLAAFRAARQSGLPGLRATPCAATSQWAATAR